MSARVVPQSLLSGSTNNEEIQGARACVISGENTKDSDNDAKKNPLPAWEHQKQRSVTPDLAPDQLAARLRREKRVASEVFKLVDVDGDDNINVSELGNLAQKLSGKGLSNDLITQIINQCDKNGDSMLSLQEFEEMYHQFNEARRADHRAQTILIREKLDRNVSVSTSTKCINTCVGAAETECCVYHKHLLLLASTIVFAAMVPLLGFIFRTDDLSKFNGYGFALSASPFWVLVSTWMILCYYYAFPKRQPIWLLVLLAIFYGGVGFIQASALACQNGIFYSTFNVPAAVPSGWKFLRSVAAGFLPTLNILLLILYTGPVVFKGLYGVAVFLICIMASPAVASYYLGVYASALVSIVLLLIIVIAIRINEHIHKHHGGKRIGGSRAYTAMMSVTLPIVVNVLGGQIAYYAFQSFTSTTETLVFFFVFIAIKLQVRDALAIAASSAFPDDVTTVVFMFYPIFSLQYVTEMMYLSKGENALSAKFFILLGIKILMCSLSKGGAVVKWTTDLRAWVRRREEYHKILDKNHQGETSPENDKRNKITGPTMRRTESFMELAKRLKTCRLAERVCVWIIPKLIKIVFSFLSNTSGQTCHDIEGLTEHQRVVQQTVVTFTLISMSNLSSLACSLGGLSGLFIEWTLPPSKRLLFEGVSDEGMLTTLIAFTLVLLTNFFVLFVSNWSKYSRWKQLQVLFNLSQMDTQDLVQDKSNSVRKAKAKFMHILHRKKVAHGARKKSLVASAHGASRASMDEIFIDAELHGNKLYRLERQLFQKHFWLLLLMTIYLTYNCSWLSLHKRFTTKLQREHGAFRCNWTTALNGTRPLVPPISWGYDVCGSGQFPDLSCTPDCAVNYPNSSYWDQNCTIYD